MLVYRKNFLRIAELWFDEPRFEPRVDIIRYLQQPKAVPNSACNEKHTLLIDLTQEQTAIMAAFTSGTRNEVRRAEARDGIVSESPRLDDRQVISQFLDFYNTFAAQKGLHPLGRSRLDLLARTGKLDISVAKDSAGAILVYHVHCHSAQRARLLHSASLFRATSDNQYRNMIGRANRFLHLQDMLRFKARGIPAFDLGGWYAGKTDEVLLRINRFKEEFGGTPVCEFNCEQGLTRRGNAALRLHRLVRRLR